MEEQIEAQDAIIDICEHCGAELKEKDRRIVLIAGEEVSLCPKCAKKIKKN